MKCAANNLERLHWVPDFVSLGTIQRARLCKYWYIFGRIKNVLMLRHDFEPIIDFDVVGKLSAEAINIKFIKNCGGELKELPIDVKTDTKPVVQALANYVKYIEHNGMLCK